MNLLALDTSTPTAALAVVRCGGLARGLLSDPNQRHGRTLLRDLRDLSVDGQPPSPERIADVMARYATEPARDS